jgi:hypothetical protein
MLKGSDSYHTFVEVINFQGLISNHNTLQLIYLRLQKLHNGRFCLNPNILKNPKMSFNGQPNMVFSKIISFTCDYYLKLDILNPMNLFFGSNG